MSQKKSFLFLQGPHGPFFERLGEYLLNKGHKVRKINFNGGDWFNWHKLPYNFYNKPRKFWRIYIRHYVEKYQVTDVFLYGDCRPMHQQAIEVLKDVGIKIHVLEEGYYRPHWITYEQGGVNGNSLLLKTLPKHLENYTLRPINPPLHMGEITKGLLNNCVKHYFVRWLTSPFFPFFRTHRPHSSIKEAIAWIRRLVNKEKRNKDAELKKNFVERLKKPIFLFPLQLESDYQIRCHSSFKKMTDIIDLVTESFFKKAPRNAYLIIKNHPLDNGLNDYGTYLDKILTPEQRKWVIYVDGGFISLFLAKAKGMVTVNSTCAYQALERGVPVKVLGAALFNQEGLCDQKSLDQFWKKPTPPVAKVYKNFKNFMMNENQFNGSFYTTIGIETLIPQIASKVV